ncbi:MAG: stkP 5 [Gemmataceae bacterium]|nr:stkP 5 [Gemmataceae bacterium]
MSNASSNRTASPPCIPGLEIQEKIGEGGMSVVYRAVHLNLQRRVAVKVLRAPVDDGTGAPAWARESRLMAALAHPHVVTIHDAGQVGGHNYLVMEDMAGGSLRARMEPGRPWSLAQAGPVLDRVAQALDHIHHQGVLHLDLKPENILYTADGQIKITDFGLSVPRADATALPGGRRFQGTVDYSAPEQLAGRAPDGRYDVFSLATLAYELLTGLVPGRVYVPASRRNPRLPAALDDVLRRGLARDRQERYPSVAPFRQALAGAARPARSRGPARWLGAVAGLAALVVVLFVLVGRKSPTPTVPPQPPERPTRLWVLYDKPDDLSLFGGAEGRDLSGDADVAVECVRVDNPPQTVPPELPVPIWPTPRPVLVVHSPRAWGFVHPLLDRTLGQRVVRDWPALLRTVVPPEKNLVRAGGFDGDCLATDSRGTLWRVGNVADWKPTRQITLDRPRDRPDNPTLLLTNLDPATSNDLLGCFQSFPSAPPPDAVVALRYRARAEAGRAHVQVYLGLPVLIPPEDTGVAATRIRAMDRPLPPEPADPTPDRWWYRIPAWVTPTADWQTYLVVFDLPPFPARVTHRNLVVDVIGTGQIRVDDVELFVWQPGSEP